MLLVGTTKETARQKATVHTRLHRTRSAVE